MKIRIHSGNTEYPDSVIIEGESIENLRPIAQRERNKRGWVNAWSELLAQ